jgi:hypothetical protein
MQREGLERVSETEWQVSIPVGECNITVGVAVTAYGVTVDCVTILWTDVEGARSAVTEGKQNVPRYHAGQMLKEPFRPAIEPPDGVASRMTCPICGRWSAVAVGMVDEDRSMIVYQCQNEACALRYGSSSWVPFEFSINRWS